MNGHVDTAQGTRRICKNEGMELIITNPCFEVWLLDHLVCCPDTFPRQRMRSIWPLCIPIFLSKKTCRLNHAAALPAPRGGTSGVTRRRMPRTRPFGSPFPHSVDFYLPLTSKNAFGFEISGRYSRTGGIAPSVYAGRRLANKGSRFLSRKFQTQRLVSK